MIKTLPPLNLNINPLLNEQVIEMSEEKENTWIDSKWEEKTAPLNTFNSEHEKSKDEDIQEVIELANLQISRGTRRPELRADMWIALRKTYDGLPSIDGVKMESPMPHGRTSTKYLSIQEGLNFVRSIAEQAQEKALEIEGVEFLMFTRTGKGEEQKRFKLTPTEQIKRAGDSAVATAKNWFDAGFWKGTPEDLANIAPHIAEDEPDA